MKIALLLFVSLVGLLYARDIPVLSKDPSLEYEIIDPKNLPKPTKPNITPSSNQNKTFSYDPIKKEWTVVKPSDEVNEGTLLWNQNNDKWLTQAFRP